ncbi:putative fructose-bisphosphatase [Rosa chinensis]|uniref:fructose-bisphosphatase n=1 Tax=Rosa chinensis TaxID=74649 RepID=A0A2P6PE22_ROSCH|nr:putative fructose-bisphosphatase [Rosa chinensis]
MDHAAEAHRTDLMTITRFVLNEQSKYPEARGDFTMLLNHIVIGCKFVCSTVSKAGLAKLPGLARETNVLAGLAKLFGLARETNVLGEKQKKLDVLSNEVFIKALISSGRTVSLLKRALQLSHLLEFNQTEPCCILVSEEDEEATFVEPSKRGRYIVVFDPLDGSSNINCGVSVGTIFGIYMVKDKENPTLADVLRPGSNMVAAGYCMYGRSCTLVLSTGNGVNGFTLDPSLGEFLLTHPNIRVCTPHPT